MIDYRLHRSSDNRYMCPCYVARCFRNLSHVRQSAFHHRNQRIRMF